MEYIITYGIHVTSLSLCFMSCSIVLKNSINFRVYKRLKSLHKHKKIILTNCGQNISVKVLVEAFCKEAHISFIMLLRCK